MLDYEGELNYCVADFYIKLLVDEGIISQEEAYRLRVLLIEKYRPVISSCVFGTAEWFF